MVGWAAYTGKTQLANDVKEDQHYFQGFPAAAATKAELSVPIELTERVIGVLDIQSDRLNAFDETDVMAMETLSDQIAVAIENARLFSKVQQLKEFNETIVQGMEGGVLIENNEGHIMFVNPKMETMLGYSQAELVGQHWSKIIPPMWVEKVAEEMKRRSQGVKGRYEAALLHSDGAKIPVAVSANPLFEAGEFVGVLTVFTDITETRRRIAEAERDQLQGELHETLNVLHAGVMLEAEATLHWLQEEQYDHIESGLGQLWKASRYAYGELSNIMQDLRDPILENVGIVGALANYASTVGPDLVSVHSNLESRLNRDLEHALYRIAQGAISNAIRHAGLRGIEGGKIQVKLTGQDGNVTLRVEDNGKGFDPDAAAATFGLSRMKQWAGMLGATLQIDSQLGRGTTVTTIVSLRERGHPHGQSLDS
jgi:PAS domain S-box-containing protein